MFESEPKSAVGLLTLGWGYVDADGVLHRDALFREMTGKEEDILSDRSGSFVAKTRQVFTNCLVRLGSIEDPRELARAVANFTAVDRMQVLMHLRKISLGEQYRMAVQCSKCGFTMNKMVDLGQIPNKHPENPELRIRKDKLPSGKEVVWEVLTGGMEEITAKVREYEERSKDARNKRTNKDLEQARLSFAMWVRVHELDGVAFSRRFPTDSDGVPVVNMEELEMLQNLSLRDRLWMRRRIEVVEAGPDLGFEFRCDSPACKQLQDSSIDIAQVEFFFPSEV